MEYSNDTFSIFFLLFDFTHKHLFVYQAVSGDGRHVKDSRCSFRRQDTFHCTESNIIVQFLGRETLYTIHVRTFISISFFFHKTAFSLLHLGWFRFIHWPYPDSYNPSLSSNQIPKLSFYKRQGRMILSVATSRQNIRETLSQWSLVNCLEEFKL